MKIQGEHRFQAPRDEVWKALLDPEVLSRTVPGSEGLEQTADNEFRGQLKMKIGPVQGLFEGKVQLSDLDPPNGYKMKIEGRGAPGFLNATGLISLSDAGSDSSLVGATLLHYEVDAQVGGRIASVGQRLVESAAKVITRQALEGLEAQIDARVAARADAGDARADAGDAGDGTGDAVKGPPAPAPTQARAAAGFAGGLLNELLPKGANRWLLLAAILALGFALFQVFKD